MSTIESATDPAALLEEEGRLALPSLDEADAIAIGRLLLARAQARSLAVTIEVRRVGRVVFRAALPGTSPDNDVWIAGKAAVVERFGHSSWYVRQRYLAEGTTFEAATGLGRPAYAPHGGGYPLAVRGTGIVGVALVSGLPQERDHALIVEALEAYLAGERA
ncbi:MAG: heme-degrading domain-containing protein [Candidatus Limnocylindrales bacterium]